MALTAKAGGNIDPCPAGNHIARCISVIDLGTQTTEYNGETRHAHQVRIIWELPLEQKVFKEEKGKQPYIISRTYTLSLGKKATLRADLVSWRGKEFTEDELRGFNLENILGAYCMLNIVHKQERNDTYANVSSVASIPKGMSKPEGINPTTFFSLEEYDDNVFQSLPDKTKEKIQKSPEFQNLGNPNHSEASPPPYGEEDIPF